MVRERGGRADAFAIDAAFARRCGFLARRWIDPGAKGGKPQPGKRMPDPYSDGARYGGGRADVRLAMGGDGELYLLCKTDGWIRKLVAVTTPPPTLGTTTQ